MWQAHQAYGLSEVWGQPGFRFRLMGRRLLPLTLARYRWLMRIDSPLVAQRATRVTALDVLRAAWIGSMPYGKPIPALWRSLSWWSRLRLFWRYRSPAKLEGEIKVFQAWFKVCAGHGPEQPGSGIVAKLPDDLDPDDYCAFPPIETLHAQLHAWTNLTDDQIWNLTPAEAHWRATLGRVCCVMEKSEKPPKLLTPAERARIAARKERWEKEGRQVPSAEEARRILFPHAPGKKRYRVGSPPPPGWMREQMKNRSRLTPAPVDDGRLGQ